MKRALILLSLIWTLDVATTHAVAAEMCIPEDAMPPISMTTDDAAAPVEFSAMLDGLWVDAQARSKIQALTPRPRFCFGWEPRVVATSQGPRRLLGTYNEDTNRADISLTPVELGRDGVCVIRHEMLHALLGHDEAIVLQTQGCTPAVGGSL